ncbi:MAG: LPS export ABC transporter periplasmic protein LptC [Bacteroidales bacterium]|nr:LPS export ABC transporter periplasmic protein LptC [Bacteroidales bacterium]
MLKNFPKVILKSTIPIFFGIVLFSCENDISVVQALQIDETLPIETSYNITSEIVDSGKVKIKIISPQVDRFEGELEYVEMKKGIDVQFFDSIGKVSSSLKANYAKNIPTDHIIIAKYNVIATNQNGEKLYTEELVWDQNTKKIYSNVAVKVVSPDKVILGDGMIADENFENWVIKNPRGDIEADIEGDEE